MSVGIRVGIITAAGALAATAAQAQFENSVWPGFKGTAVKHAAVSGPGPAVNHAFTLATFGVGAVSPGGFQVAADGSIYFKTYSVTQSKIYRINPTSGAVLAESVDFGGNAGNYGGVAIGVDAVYACNFNGAGNTKIIKLNKQTLAVISEFTNAAFGGLRGSPLIGSVTNTNGNVNLYVNDRENSQIHAVDSVTGQVMWTYTTIYNTFFAQSGPMWVAQDGKQVIAYSGNGNFGPSAAIKDNGDTTFTVLWEATGAGNFQWFGSGALSGDGQRIYFPTFSDALVAGGPRTNAMWCLDAATGNLLWDAGDGNQGANHFGRPAVIDNRIYCGAGDARIWCYQDNTNSGTVPWVYQHATDRGEFTSVAAVKTAGGDRYIYGVIQEVFIGGQGNGKARLVVLKDNGASATEVLDTTLNDTMRFSLFASNGVTVDAAGSLWVSGGRRDDPTPGDIYKFGVSAPCYPDCNGDGNLNLADFGCFQTKFALGDPYADCNGDGNLNLADFGCFQTKFALGCP